MTSADAQTHRSLHTNYLNNLLKSWWQSPNFCAAKTNHSTLIKLLVKTFANFFTRPQTNSLSHTSLAEPQRLPQHPHDHSSSVANPWRAAHFTKPQHNVKRNLHSTTIKRHHTTPHPNRHGAPPCMTKKEVGSTQSWAALSEAARLAASRPNAKADDP